MESAAGRKVGSSFVTRLDMLWLRFSRFLMGSIPAGQETTLFILRSVCYPEGGDSLQMYSEKGGITFCSPLQAETSGRHVGGRTSYLAGGGRRLECAQTPAR